MTIPANTREAQGASMNSQTTELLPCPFCGGKASGSWSFGSVYIECTGCCASVATSGGETAEDCERIAAEKWNRRAALEHAQRVAQSAVLVDEEIDRIAAGMYTPVGYSGFSDHPSNYGNWCREFARAILAAATPSAGEARDAARYRWLRDHVATWAPPRYNGRKHGWYEIEVEWDAPNQLDIAIDETMAEAMASGSAG